MRDEKEVKIVYSRINHDIRKKLDISLGEYVYLDSVYKLQNNDLIKGWCYASNKYFQDFFGYTPRGIQKMKQRLIEKDLLRKQTNPQFRTILLQTTEKYNEYRKGEQKHSDIEQSSPLYTNKVRGNPERSSYNSSINSSKDNKKNSAPNKSAPPRDSQKEKQTDSRVRNIHDWFYSYFEKRYGVKPAINGGASGSLIKQRLKALDSEGYEPAAAEAEIKRIIRFVIVKGEDRNNFPYTGVKTIEQALAANVWTNARAAIGKGEKKIREKPKKLGSHVGCLQDRKLRGTVYRLTENDFENDLKNGRK